MFGDDQNDQQQNDNSNGLGSPWPPDPATNGSPGVDNGTTSPITDVVPSTPPDNSLPAAVAPPVDDTPVQAAPAASNDLLDIKQQALQHLSPLVGHLDQTPEEKFRTTMMMIQASDDQSLIHSAFEAAKQITDDKARAQAFLDVINEINYFTQQHS